MLEEPKQDRGAQEAEQKGDIWDYLKDFKEFFLANTPLASSALYLYVTLIGLTYSAELYGSFRINILDYSEIGDFLLAAFKNLVTLVAAGLLAALGIFATMWAGYRLATEGTGRGWRRLLLINALLFTALSAISPVILADSAAASIKDGEKPAVDVRYKVSSATADAVNKTGVELIGATTKAVFFYDVNDKRTIVIPQAQIVSIKVPE